MGVLTLLVIGENHNYPKKCVGITVTYFKDELKTSGLQSFCMLEILPHQQEATVLISHLKSVSLSTVCH